MYFYWALKFGARVLDAEGIIWDTEGTGKPWFNDLLQHLVPVLQARTRNEVFPLPNDVS